MGRSPACHTPGTARIPARFTRRGDAERRPPSGALSTPGSPSLTLRLCEREDSKPDLRSKGLTRVLTFLLRGYNTLEHVKEI